MSRIYDDLKRNRQGKAGPETDDEQPLDLFAFAAARQEQNAPAAEPEPVPAPSSHEEAPPPEAPVVEPVPPVADPAVEPDDSSPRQDEQAATSHFRRGLEARRPYTSVILPLRESRMPNIFGRERNRFVMAAAGLAVVVVVGVLLAFAFRGRDRGALPEGSATAARETSAVQLPPPSPKPPPVAAARVVPKVATPASARRTEPRPADAAGPALGLKVPGAIVKTEGPVSIVTFEHGLFTGGTRLGRDGQKALRAIARAVAPYGKRASVTVIGCTDNVALTPGSRFEDNQALGLARAEAVLRFLQSESGLPAAVFQALSYGERWSPYPNQSPADRARNRTAVLRISVK